MNRGFLATLSIANKLYLGFGSIGLLLILIALLTNWCMTALYDHSQNSLKSAVNEATLAGYVALNTLDCRRYEKDMFLNMADPQVQAEYQSKWEKEFKDLETAIANYAEAAHTDASQEQARQWKASTTEYRRGVQEVLERIANGAITEPSQANQALIPFKDPIRALTEGASQATRQSMVEMAETEEGLRSIVSLFRVLVLIVTLVAVVACVAWGYVLVTDLTRPLKELSNTAGRVAEGDLYTRVDVDRQDELGTVADSFNQMLARLRDYSEQSAASKE